MMITSVEVRKQIRNIVDEALLKQSLSVTDRLIFDTRLDMLFWLIHAGDVDLSTEEVVDERIVREKYERLKVAEKHVNLTEKQKIIVGTRMDTLGWALGGE